MRSFLSCTTVLILFCMKIALDKDSSEVLRTLDVLNLPSAAGIVKPVIRDRQAGARNRQRRRGINVQLCGALLALPVPTDG